MATTFDAPSGEACIARREVSNTPLQALTLLNDVVFIEAAQALGRHFAAQGGSTEDRIHITFPPLPDASAARGRGAGAGAISRDSTATDCAR